ncbi:hypothetical protein BpHYR1_035879 [Brachionus plicatilis]|uniref:Uncharacterized protein n=1 Tax=Brachionus plicatilis TaxID=10195 RepID=A0A3M7QUJ4_BRAPC|nr:hypothetical protein BpHYR1_035879 [Brachionus plicatilis]
MAKLLGLVKRFERLGATVIDCGRMLCLGKGGKRADSCCNELENVLNNLAILFLGLGACLTEHIILDPFGSVSSIFLFSLTVSKQDKSMDPSDSTSLFVSKCSPSSLVLSSSDPSESMSS